jgi:predicted Zn-dependent peptidase
MYRLASLALAGESYRSLDQVMDLIDSVTESDALEAASLYDPDRLAILELSPE